jgi:hypothetical protein
MFWDIANIRIRKWREEERPEKYTYPASSLFPISRKRISQQSMLHWLIDIDGLPTCSQHTTRGEDIFDKGVYGEPSDILKCMSAHHVARSGAQSNPEQTLEGLHKAEERYKGLLWRIVLRNFGVQPSLLANEIQTDV